LVPRIQNPALRAELAEMLDAHVRNIDEANRALEARGAPTR
jgi:hypothetical protein